MNCNRLHGLTCGRYHLCSGVITHSCEIVFLGTACYWVLSGPGCSWFSSSCRQSRWAPFHAWMCLWISADHDCYLGLLTIWFGPQLIVTLILREQSEFLPWYWEGGSASWLVQLSAGPLPKPGKLAPPIIWDLCGSPGLGVDYSNSGGKVIGGFLMSKQNDLVYSLKSSPWLFPASVLRLTFLIYKTGDWDKLFHLA